MLVCNQYFVKGRAMAMSASMTSAGLGTIVYGYLQTFLIDQFGLQGTLLINGGIFLHVCLCGQLFFPNDGIVKDSKTGFPREQGNIFVRNTNFQIDTNIASMKQDSQSDMRFMGSLALSIDVIAENNNKSEPSRKDAFVKGILLLIK